MKLFAKISDPGLLLKSLCELGTAFYRRLEGGVYEAIYFSGSRTIYFRGELSRQQLKSLKALAYPAESISLDEEEGTVEVSQ